MKIVYLSILSFFLTFPIFSISAEKVNINTASKDVLIENIKGVGEKKAQAIIKYRKKNGKFNSINELVEVQGIGPDIIEKNQKQLSIK